MERITEITPAYDKRNPDPSKNYGIHGVNLKFVLKGELGAVQFLIFTNWQLPHVQREFGHQGPMAADIGYHSPMPMYDGQIQMADWEYLDGKPCYYDGSGLYANHFFDVMVSQGGDAMWAAIEQYYVERFGELR